MRRLLLVALLSCSALFAQEGSASEEAGDKLAVWKWANFAILSGLIGYACVKSLPAVFAARTKEIQQGIAEAQKVKQDAEKRAAEITARLGSLTAEIERLRSQAALEMQQEGDRIRQESEAQVRKLSQQATLEIDSAGKNARRELKTFAAALAIDLAEQRVRSGMNSSTEAALVEGFVADLKRKGANN